MLGELIGLGLIGLAAKLGKLTIDEERRLYRDAYEAAGDILSNRIACIYEPKINDCFQAADDYITEEDREWWTKYRKNPCSWAKREEIRDTEEALDNLRRFIRHPDFNINRVKDVCEEDPVNIEQAEEDYIPVGYICSEWDNTIREAANEGVRDLLKAQKFMRDNCPSIWTEDQGLEGYVTREGPRKFCVRNEPTGLIIKTKKGPRCYPTRKQAVKVWHALDCKYTGRHC